ncbi:MAG: hypothetical protein AB7U05_10170 [Mangrovibacterium sp.]
MRAKRLIIIIVPIITAVLVSWNFYLHSPQYSIKQIKKSVHKKQRIKFEQYVDIENLSKQAVEAFINQTMLEAWQENEDGWGLLGSALGNRLFESMKPTIVSLLRTSIEESVENGNFQKLFTKTDANKNISLDKMQNIFSINPNSFSGYNIETYKDFGILSLNFPSEIFDTTLVINLKIKDIGSYWKVISFDNLEKYLTTLEMLKGNILNEKNAINRMKLDSLVSFGDVNVKYWGDGYFDEYIKIYINVTNNSSDTLNYLTIKLKSSKEDISYDFYLYTSILYPKETKTISSRTINYNMFISWHEDLKKYGKYCTPYIESVMISGKSGKYLKQYSNWDDYLNEAFN